MMHSLFSSEQLVDLIEVPEISLQSEKSVLLGGGAGR